MNFSNQSFETIYDSDQSDDIEFVSFHYQNDQTQTNFSYQKIHLPMELNEPEKVTSTPFPQKTSPIKKIETQIEGSILKSHKKSISKSTKKVVFVSPKIIDIPSIDARIRRSVYGENIGKTPVKPILPVRPRSLTYSDVKQKTVQTKSSKIPILKRLISPSKPIENPQKIKKGTNSSSVNIKGVRMNKRFELQMKNLFLKKNL